MKMVSRAVGGGRVRPAPKRVFLLSGGFEPHLELIVSKD